MRVRWASGAWRLAAREIHGEASGAGDRQAEQKLPGAGLAGFEPRDVGRRVGGTLGLDDLKGVPAVAVGEYGVARGAG